jgi:rubrerythrin
MKTTVPVGCPEDDKEELMDFKSVDEILAFAIGKEQEAADFYTDLADKMDRQHMKDIFLDFADEEKRHKAKLEGVREGNVLLKSEEKVVDLKIGDHLIEVESKPKMSFQEALMVAIQNEANAYTLYKNLAVATDDAGLRDTFLGLAQEEAKHKLRFEVEYDDYVYQEN